MVRKFGSSPGLPTQPELKEKEMVDGGQRTRPNHYITDHQLVTDAQGRSVLTASNPTLLIGGVPFHLQGAGQHAPGTYYASNGSYSYASYQPNFQNSVYPVYETIGSDYSEMSSVYSDRLDSSAGSGVKLMSRHLVSPDARHFLIQNPSNSVQESRSTGMSPEMALLQRLQEQQFLQPAVHGGHHHLTSGGHHLTSGRPVTRSPLRNLPVQRSKSLKVGQRGPLPAPPKLSSSSNPSPSNSISSTPPSRASTVDSTISLENPPPSSSPITQL